MPTPDLPTPDLDFDPTDDSELFDSKSDRVVLDAIIDRLPQFVPIYLALAEACDGVPDQHSVLSALADFVLDHLALIHPDFSALPRAMDLVESLLEPASDSVDSDDHSDSCEDADDIEAAELIALSFFDSFPPESRADLVQWLGPRSLAALESLDGPIDGRPLP